MEKTFNNVFVWLILIVAIIWDFAIPYILAPFYSGYSSKTMVMSSLGNPDSPVKIYYNTWLIVLGNLLSISACTIYVRYSAISRPLSISVAILILIFAVGAGILSGIFSVNESKELATLASMIHGVGSALGFIASLFVPLLMAILSFKDHDKTAGIVCIVSFTLAFLFFILFVMADKPTFRSTIISHEGLWQRLTLLFMYVPFGYIAIKNLISAIC